MRARARRRRSAWPWFGQERGIDSSEPLKGQLWTRSERSLREPDVPVARRAMAAVVALVECALLGWLWFGPVLAVRTLDVSGAQHMSAAQVQAAAGVLDGASVLRVDATGARQRLLEQTWVRTATVQPQLPGTVHITISEWEPVAAYHAGTSAKLFFLSDQSVVLGPAGSAPPASLTEVQGPAGADPKPGDRPLGQDAVLLTALVNIQRGLPGLIGQDVAQFVFDSCGDLTLVSKRGWKVYFGRVLTPEEFATLRDKVAALKAIAGTGNVDYNSADLAYVNVMNPSEPAAGYKSRAVPSPSPAPSPGARASTAPACK